MGRPFSEGPASATFSFYGVSYEVDLQACRAAMLSRAAELLGSTPADDTKSGLQMVAEAAGVHRDSVSRFLAGKAVSVETFTSIITRGLSLAVEDVAKRLEVSA